MPGACLCADDESCPPIGVATDTHWHLSSDAMAGTALRALRKSTLPSNWTLREGRYKAGLVGSERYLLTCMRYIELNPVRAGMVEHPAEYVWSSYRYNALGQPNARITPHTLYLKLDEISVARLTAYRALF